MSDDRAQKLSLIQQLAQRRKEQQGEAPGQGAKRRTIIGLSDSDDDDYDQDIRSSPRLRAEYSSVSSTTGQQPPTALNGSNRTGEEVVGGQPSRENPHLKVPIAIENDADDLVNQLRTLGLGSTARAEPPITRPTLKPTSKQAEQKATSAVDAVAETSCKPLSCLVRGDRCEFKLSAELTAKLYAHQVIGVQWLSGLYRVGSGGE